MKEKFKEFWNKILFPIFMGLFIVSVFIGSIFLFIKLKKFESPPKLNPYQHIQTISDVSIAINESSDLLIINRKTGDYTLYDDSVGQTIFRMYCNKIYKEINKKEEKQND